MVTSFKRFFFLQIVMQWLLTSFNTILDKTLVSRRDTSLEWNISQEPIATQYNDGDGNPVIRVPFLATERDYAVILYESDCKTIFRDIPFQSFKGVSSSDNSMIVTVDIPLHPGKIFTSSAWNNDKFGVCVSLELYASHSRNPNSIMVSRKDAIYNVRLTSEFGGSKYEARILTEDDYDNLPRIDGKFDSEDNETLYNNDLSFDLSGTVEAYLCDHMNNYAEIEEPEPLQKFDLLTICVREVSSDDLQINEIVTLTLVQELEGGGQLKFKAVENGEVPEMYTSLAETDCVEDEFCYTTIVLVEDFFTTGMTKPITVYGEASLSVGSNSTSGKSIDIFQVTVELDNEGDCDEGNVFNSIIARIFNLFTYEKYDFGQPWFA